MVGYSAATGLSLAICGRRIFPAPLWNRLLAPGEALTQASPLVGEWVNPDKARPMAYLSSMGAARMVTALHRGQSRAGACDGVPGLFTLLCSMAKPPHDNFSGVQLRNPGAIRTPCRARYIKPVSGIPTPCG